MGHVCNLSPSHRPPQPSLNNGPVQRRVRRAFVATGQSVLSTTQIMDWSHPRPGTNRHHARRSVRRVCERYCERVGRGTGIGRPLLWRLRNCVRPARRLRSGSGFMRSPPFRMNIHPRQKHLKSKL
jgi:hypothetical protein